MLKQRLQGIERLLKDTMSSYANHRCPLRAAALTYVTILSIVPFLAVAFSISKGLGFYNTQFIYNFLLKLTANREGIVKNIITYINNTNVGKLGGIGMTTLLLVVLSLLGTIEDTLNTIFHIPSNRTLKQKVTHYFSITLLSPILILVLVTVGSSITSISVVKRLLSYSLISHIYVFLLKILPLFMIWISIYLLFRYLPNGRVKNRGILIGSLLSSLLWQVSRFIFVYYEPFKFRYNAIYGSFAKVILVFLWMFFSWCILLLGAVMAQEINGGSRGRFSLISRLGNFNIEIKEEIFLAVITVLIQHFKRGDGVCEAWELEKILNIPTYIIEDYLRALASMGFICNSGEGYILSGDIFSCRVSDFLERVRKYNDCLPPETIAHMRKGLRIFCHTLTELKQGSTITLQELSSKLE